MIPALVAFAASSLFAVLVAWRALVHAQRLWLGHADDHLALKASSESLVKDAWDRTAAQATALADLSAEIRRNEERAQERDAASRRDAADELQAAAFDLRREIHDAKVLIHRVETMPLVDAGARTTLDLQARLAKGEEAFNALHAEHLEMLSKVASLASQVERLDDSISQEHVRAALLEHEAKADANPHLHPEGDTRHAERSVLQLAQRRIRQAGDVEPAHLPELVAAAVKGSR